MVCVGLRYHHPANKQSVLTSLIQRARTLSDQGFLPQELEFLTSVFKMNGYKPKQIQRALTLTTHTEDTAKDNQPASKAYLPYTQTTYGRLSRVLAKHNGHKVYRKPTHTNLYLHQKSHHHPANKHSVLSSLVHKAKTLCDQESLAPELTFLTNVFKQNGYSHQQIQ